MRYLSIFIIFIAIACTGKQDQKISLPDLSEDFYQTSLKVVQQQYNKTPTDILLRQKLYYYGKLDWPEEAIIDLNIYLEQHGLNRKTVSLFSEYYLMNDQYGDLIALIDKWEYYHGLDEELSQFRIWANIQAKGKVGTRALIEDYLCKFNSVDSYEFAIRESLNLEDSLLQYDLLLQFAEIAPTHILVAEHYVPTLIAEGRYSEAIAILDKHQGRRNLNMEMMRATVLYALNRVGEAKSVIRRHSNPQAMWQMSLWMKQEKSLDSAIIYIDRALSQDSSRSNVLLKAEILDERGWFYSSLDHLEILLRRDSTDTIALEKAQNVERKIAYLRNLKEKARQAPVLELEPKRIIE